MVSISEKLSGHWANWWSLILWKKILSIKFSIFTIDGLLNARTAASVAEALEIDEVRADVLPEEKKSMKAEMMVSRKVNGKNGW